MSKQRRYDLDWLRVISVFAVFLHHVLMPFNGDDFHIMNKTHSKILDDTMVYFEQFRLPLLFFISGVGSIFAFSKRSWVSFIKERMFRLSIPLIFGVLLIIPPQTFFESLDSYKSYLNAYPDLVLKFNVNHLWFIENLFLMSIVFIPFILFIRSNTSIKLKKRIMNNTKKYGVISWVLVLLTIRLVTKEFFQSDSKSFFNPSSTLYFGFFFLSGIVITSTGDLWKLLLNRRKFNFKLLIFFTILFYCYYFIPANLIKPYVSLDNRWRLWYAISSLVSWSAIITILGYGQVFLNKKSELLNKLNEAVYPFYLLHQTIIIALGYYIIRLEANIFSKIITLFTSSLILITLSYILLIYPFKWVRFLFGMKNKKI
ncbi:acyltransferase [uncultured Tenacibaculum sp.]|uniref:acyltransferase family protein n=1 Tax=uncultured Tenacibaculum sp. TaxID=174713 RepID=UPI00261885B0|nr:acyltransferase [uncultured Tenacibaculum sp.]